MTSVGMPAPAIVGRPVKWKTVLEDVLEAVPVVDEASVVEEPPVLDEPSVVDEAPVAVAEAEDLSVAVLFASVALVPDVAAAVLSADDESSVAVLRLGKSVRAVVSAAMTTAPASANNHIEARIVKSVLLPRTGRVEDECRNQAAWKGGYESVEITGAKGDERVTSG